MTFLMTFSKENEKREILLKYTKYGRKYIYENFIISFCFRFGKRKLKYLLIKYLL